ncbi:hypothetical protein VNO78_19266 [Psophocarpus tetragonolobus]|uniref:Gnk2-homologous domain-containing protein n=1 Tax=Psophocarpus tetragonolobus TaxID=3891 RepID=A0AAN9S9C1_PSOTE
MASFSLRLLSFETTQLTAPITQTSTPFCPLSTNTEIDYGFYNFSNGKSTDKVNAIGLCRGDVKPEECRNCLEQSRANLTELCPNQKEAIGWYEDEKCMLRYSDRSIMETAPAYYADNMNNATDLDQFHKDVNTLLGNLTSQAASGDSHFKYAAGAIPGSNKVIYGLVQCTPDLIGSECSNCLAQSIERIQIDYCKDNIGCRVVRPSCNMRFETSFKFYEDPAYVPPTAPSTKGESKSNSTTIAIAIAVPVVVVVAVVLIFILVRSRARKPGEKNETQQEAHDDDDEIDISDSLQFSFNTIRDATNDFSDSNKLGQGGFGAVYRAWRSWREGRAIDIIDPKLNYSSQNEIMRCIHIGLLCVQDNVAARPTMASVVLVLNSHSLTLPLPSEPAFYVDSRTGNLPNMQLWEFTSRSTTRSNNIRSTHESINEASITEPYPR